MHVAIGHGGSKHKRNMVLPRARLGTFRGVHNTRNTIHAHGEGRGLASGGISLLPRTAGIATSVALAYGATGHSLVASHFGRAGMWWVALCSSAMALGLLISVRIDDRASSELVGSTLLPAGMMAAVAGLGPASALLSLALPYAIVARRTSSRIIAQRDVGCAAIAASPLVLASMLHIPNWAMACIWAVLFAVGVSCISMEHGRLVVHRQRPRVARLWIPMVSVLPPGIAVLIPSPVPAITIGVLGIGGTWLLISRSVVVRSSRNTTSEMLADLVDDRVEGRADHSLNVAHMGALVAHHLGCSQRVQSTVWWTARLCDMGLLLADTTALTSSSTLAPDNRSMARFHAVRSAEVAASLGYPPRMVDAIVAHHERWDGTGLLQQAGERIPIASRIVAVCDAVVSMREPRPHRPPLADEQIVAALRDGAGTQFERDVAMSVAALIEEGAISGRSAVDPEESMEAIRREGSQRRIFFDPAIPGSSYRRSTLRDAQRAVAGGLWPVLLIRQGTARVDLTWWTMEQGEVWAAPTTVVSGTDVAIFRYSIDGAELSVIDDQGGIRARIPAPGPASFEWVPPSRLRAGAPIAATILIAIGMGVSLSRTVLRVTEVVGSEMSPAIECGSFVVDTPQQQFERGDVVVVEAPRALKAIDPSAPERFTSRVVGVPGDRVAITRSGVTVDGSNIIGPAARPVRRDLIGSSWSMGARQYFVIADYRLHAPDSRMFGPVRAADISGKVRAIVWPLSDITSTFDFPSDIRPSACVKQSSGSTGWDTGG